MRPIIDGPLAAADTYSDTAPGKVVLGPAERAYIAGAVAARYQEFVTARWCARRAMTVLGLPEAEVAPGPHGEPCWPRGVVGSITHCTGYRGAVVARSTEVAAIGIDAEPNEPLPAGGLDAISLPQERAWVDALTTTRAAVCWDRLLFCAKEAVFKAWYPLTGRRLAFDASNVSVDQGQQTFSALLRTPGPRIQGKVLTGLTGRWLVTDGLLLTAIVVPQPVSA
jgi:4'-phosphopantetheinyl transferase EntD